MQIFSIFYFMPLIALVLIVCITAFAQAGHVLYKGQVIPVKKLSNGSEWFMQDLGGDGKKYNWLFASSREACPLGWHLPSNDDWKALSEAIMQEGRLIEDFSKSKTAHWWSSSQHDGKHSHLWYVSGNVLNSIYTLVSDAYSVRCVRDNNKEFSSKDNL